MHALNLQHCMAPLIPPLSEENPKFEFEFLGCLKICSIFYISTAFLRAQLARQMALLPTDQRLTREYLARTAGLAEVPSTREDNPVLGHLLPVHTQRLPPRGTRF